MTFDAALPGTPATEWKADGRLDALPLLDLASIEHLVVVAAHPDDETLGAGGLISECSLRGIPVTVVVVTDGSASHPQSMTASPEELSVIRQRELFMAVSELAPDAEVVMLGFADGDTEGSRGDIAVSLDRAIEPGWTVVAPWRGDGHRDHRVVAEVCAELVLQNGATLLEYPIWMWHWADPDDERVPWDSAVAFRLGHSAVNAKRRAVARHVSQVVGLGPSEGDGPVLSPEFSANFDRERELFVITTDVTRETKSRQYFEALYAGNSDPWRMGTRWYEERKRSLTVASLPRDRFGRGLEIGCSVGELTAALAPHCSSLLAVDISAAAVSTAASRLAAFPAVRVEQTDATVTFPSGTFDLIVLSEVAYYWDRATLAHMIREVSGHLAPDAVVLTCHWRHPVDDYPLGGEEVQQLLWDGLALTRLAFHDEADFLLEVFTLDPRSVAAREGLVD